MKVFIIAGEASGDQHAAGVAAELKALDPTVDMQGWGGDKMAAAGVSIHKHIRELAFMGFAEIIMNLGRIIRNFRQVKEQIRDFKPDAILLVDYPGFNLRIAQWAKTEGFKVYYYIAPQLWAWKPGRIRIFKKYVDRLFVILPFEVEWFQSRGVEVIYTGHPLMEVIPEKQPGPIPAQPLVALLPGSRKQEIRAILPVMMQVVDSFPECRFVLAGAPAIDPSFYHRYLKDTRVELMENRTYELLEQANAALVASGTATLETALHHVPQIVCYRGSALSVWLARQIVKVPYIAMVNLLLNKPLVPELIQSELNKDQLTAHLKALLYGELREKQLGGYSRLRQMLKPADGKLHLAQFILKSGE